MHATNDVDYLPDQALWFFSLSWAGGTGVNGRKNTIGKHCLLKASGRQSGRVDPSLNPVHITFTEYLFSNCIEKTKINQPRPGASPIKILQQKKIGYVNFLSFLIGWKIWMAY